MITTYGTMPTTLPPGYFKAVRFPVLAKLDEITGDGRLLDSAGAKVRPLPLTIRAQFVGSYGHEGAVITGALFETTVDPESGVMSGRGFLLNDANGRNHARMIATQAMRTNSVDLADIEARYEEDLATGEVVIRFTKYSLAATTGVATPAFADAYAEVDPLTDDELMASLVGDDPMVELVASCEHQSIVLVLPEQELVASGTPRPPFEAFHRPEADAPQKIVVDENGFVYGHLSVWDTCHDGDEARCTITPRPEDNYASFNKPGVLTDGGMVETGPIFAYGGHRSAGAAPTIEQAYGGIENAWADVRATVGRFGPWVCGIVRPGTDDTTVYSARASRISGHWVGGRLKAIVSVNGEGFDVPGSGLSFAPFAFATDDTGVTELVASFPTCLSTEGTTNEEAPTPSSPEQDREGAPQSETVQPEVEVEAPADEGEVAAAMLRDLIEEDD